MPGGPRGGCAFGGKLIKGGLGAIIPGGGKTPLGGIGNPLANCCAAACAATEKYQGRLSN